MRRTLVICLVWLVAAGAHADGKGKHGSLQDLLAKVQSGFREAETAHQDRVEQFTAKREQQQELLDQAKQEEVEAQQRAEELEQALNANEQQVKDLKEMLVERTGSLGELFGVVRQVAGESRARLHESIVTARLGDRSELLDRLAQSERLPAVDDLSKMWFLLHQEITESGRVERFKSDVLVPDGHREQRDVVRIGTFGAVTGDRYLQWLPEVGQLSELHRQPPEERRQSLPALGTASEGFTPVWVDPSRGAVLALLVETPDLRERIGFGGVIGYIILGLGGVTFVFGFARLLYILFVGMRVRWQRAHPDEAAESNPLGRVLAIFHKDHSQDLQTLEARLNEAVMREAARLERFLWAIKMVGFVAPLLGLLGTVTGMIQTFQAITLFGTGDPKLMAGGISEALVTTMLGLVVAVPLVLLHGWLRTLCRRLGDVLYEQSAGLIALQTERERG